MKIENLGKGQKMKTNQIKLGKVSKALVALLTLGSLLGVSSAQAAEEGGTHDYIFDIYVENTCSDGDLPATWSPASTPLQYDYVEAFSTTVDLVDGPVTVDLLVDVGFEPGTDGCTLDFTDPSGTVSTALLLPDGLESTYRDCAPSACDAADLYLFGASMIVAEITIPADTEPALYQGTLSVTWTPVTAD